MKHEGMVRNIQDIWEKVDRSNVKLITPYHKIN
jgi:hypothetical protein